MIEPLFAPGPRVDPRPIQPNEGLLTFLDRYAKAEQAREVLQQWFEQFPPQHQELARRDLNLVSEEHQWSAVTELATHDLLLQLGQRPEVKPAVYGQTPDFSIGELLIEATAALGAAGPGSNTPIEKAVLAELNRILSPDFWIFADTSGELTRMPPLGAWKRRVATWLHELSAGSITADEFVLDQGDWHLRLKAVLKSPETRGHPDHYLISAGPGHSWWGDGGAGERIGQKIRSKTSAYRESRRDLVVVVNVVDVTANEDSPEIALRGPRGAWGPMESGGSLLRAVVWMISKSPWNPQAETFVVARSVDEIPVPLRTLPHRII